MALHDALLVALAVLVTLLVARLARALHRERELSRTDPLTGVSNRRAFSEHAAREVHRARRTGRPITVAYVDVDDFKRLNDRFGHSQGDAILREVASALRGHVRPYDVVARLGGDEFAVLLPEVEAAHAPGILEGLAAAVRERLHGRRVSVSLGAVTFEEAPRDADDLLDQADRQMYAAKRSGKGRVVLGVFERRAG